MEKLKCFVCVALVLGPIVSAFNLDTYNYVRHETGKGTMFGFSVTLHQEGRKAW